jgi:NAD(P)-dependent dehydrogenase (short-subunit alcohol dehydrogenase family)
MTLASTDPRPLDGKVAIVTGAGRGIGRAIALGLANHGASVVLVARSAPELDRVAAEITASGGTARAVTADVSTEDGVESIAAAIIGRSPSILINAAGVFGPIQPIVDSNPDEWMRTLAINTVAPYLTSRRFAPAMIAAGWGRILNVTSAAALHTPGPLNSAYAVSKVALNQFTRHLAVELAGSGVTANVLHPGEVKTEMFEDIERKVTDPDSNYGRWVQWVKETGGDPPHKAVELVLKVVESGDWTPNGEFLWIEDPLQAPVPSW